jgi:hypothetical protein
MNMWELEWIRKQNEERKAIAENEARIKNLKRNLKMFPGTGDLTGGPIKTGIPQIPSSTTFNPYTIFDPNNNPSTRIRDEVNEIIRRQNLDILRDYGPVTEDKLPEWIRRVDPNYDKDAFNAGRQAKENAAYKKDLLNQEIRRGWNDIIQELNQDLIDKENLNKQSKPIDNSPMARKQRQFEAANFGPDSTIARMRKLDAMDKIPTWDIVGPQDLATYVDWLKKQGRYQEAADIEWENRKGYKTQFGETPEKQQNRRRSIEAQNRIDVDRRIAVNGNNFEMKKSPLQLTQDASRAEFDRIADLNRRFWNTVDAQNNRRNAEKNGINIDLSNSDRNALEAMRNRFINQDNDPKIPDLSTDRNIPGLSRVPQNRTGLNNQVPTGNRFNRPIQKPISPIDFNYGGGGSPKPRNPVPYNPDGGFFGDDGEWLYDRALRDRLSKEIENGNVKIPKLMGGNQANNNPPLLIKDKPGLQRSNNQDLIGGLSRQKRQNNPATPQLDFSRPKQSSGNNNTTKNTPKIQRFGNPFVRGAGVAGGIGELYQQGKLYGDAYNSLNDYKNALEALGISKEERDRILKEYGNPKYVNGLERSVNQSSGNKPFDILDLGFQYEASRALRRGENPEKFKERYFGPQNKDDAELYRMDYKNGPIFKPSEDRWYGPFKIPGSDGYTDRQREGLNNARRRSVRGYYGKGLGEMLADLGRQISSDLNSAYRRLLKEEQKSQRLERDERRRNREYWDDLDRDPSKNWSNTGGREKDFERFNREARELDRQPILETDRSRNEREWQKQRDRDLQKQEDWNRKNPEFYKDAEYKQREKEIDYWLKNDPSKIQNQWDPFKPVPLPPDPTNPPDPNFPPLPPGLKYPIWGWEIEAISVVQNTGSTLKWYVNYIKNSDLVGDMPTPSVFVQDNGVTGINNEGGWMTGRTGLWVLPDLSYASPPAYVGSDESEIFTEQKYREIWGEKWDWDYRDPRWDTLNDTEQRIRDQDKFVRLPQRGKSNFIYGTTTITRANPIRGKQPVPDLNPITPPIKPEPEEDIMPGCSYMPDKQNPAQVSWWDKLTKSIKTKPISVHEGVDEGFEHVSKQMAELQEQINKISQVLDVDKYTAPQGKIVAPVLGMQAITTVLGSSNPLAPIPLVKTLPQENMIFSAVNYMFSGHHLLGKLQLPVDPNKGVDDLGNIARMTPLTGLGMMHKIYNNITGMIGSPSTHSIVDANGVKTPQSFKNQSDALENTHKNTLEMQQDISSLQEAVFKILQNQEMMINMIHKETYKTQFLIEDTGARVKEIMVERPSVMKHGKKPQENTQTETDRRFSWDTVFTIDKTATSVPTWDKSNELDKLQLGLKTNIQAQLGASSNFYPISKKGDQSIPSLRTKKDGEWKQFVKTINNGDQNGVYHGIAVPESKIEEIKSGIVKDIVVTDVPFIDGRTTQ